MKSLFILSLPRSYSCGTFGHARDALGLQEPIWTTEGEILNNDRHVFYQGDRREAGLKFTTRRAPNDFARVTAFLDQIVRPAGFVYKDVVQPFVTSSWLEGRTDLAVLKILPDATHVVASVLARRWSYLGLAADPGGGPIYQIVQGVLRAERAVRSVAGEEISFDALIGGEEKLRSALQRLYPAIEVPPLGYITEEFERRRAAILRRRDDPAYRLLGKLVAQQREDAAIADGREPCASASC
jgi:hypothetical protein